MHASLFAAARLFRRRVRALILRRAECAFAPKTWFKRTIITYNTPIVCNAHSKNKKAVRALSARTNKKAALASRFRFKTDYAIL